MKKVVLSMVMILVIFRYGYSQVYGDTIYFDHIWNQTTKNKASYFRLVNIDTSRILFLVRDYYLRGQLQMEGAYRSINPDVKIGGFTYWYEDGKKQVQCYFKNGSLDGQYYEWYKNGTLKAERNFTDGQLDGLEKVWTDKGTLQKSVQYKNGIKHGEFITYYSNGQPVRRDIYKNGTMIRGKCFTPQGKYTTYFEYFIMPRFKGGLEGFKQFILEKLNYPDTARLNDEEGSVHIRFTVGRDGHIKGIKLIKSDKEYFNEEVIQVVANSPKWIPGKRDGQSVDVTINLPIKFRLK
ncbi:MAG TPA: TonB family protein [Bacteroidales bacterium]|nr:TonB family protein [Bacteroidales bacterium]